MSNHAQHDIRLIREQIIDDSVSYRTFIYTTVGGIRRVGVIIRPTDAQLAPCPAILYVHWYEPYAPTSNRTEFRDEAIALAKQGAVSMLIETLWSDNDFFLKRTQADDENNTIQQVVELRQAMDILLAEPDIDPQRFALVGHDFGGMYGVLAGSLDPRPSHYVIMAATPRFHEWYLYAPPLDGDARDEFIERMAQYDPINRLGKLAGVPLLFQMADDDPHVPVERAEEFFAAAHDPKDLKWYPNAGHGLNEAATADRMAWLGSQLGLKSTP